MNLRDKEQLCDVLKKFIATENESVSAIFKTELIDTGKMSNYTARNILFGRTHPYNLDISALIWIYSAISKYKSGMPDIKRYFEEIEIKKAASDREKVIQSQYPLVFDATQLLPKEQYLTTLNIRTINALQINGIIQVDANMQRESEIVVFNGQLISHVSYNDNKAINIDNSLIDREYWSDTIRWNLIKDEFAEYEYDSDTQKLIISKGSIVLLDGQHRTRAMEYALIREPDLEYNFPIIISIATVKEAQQIIAQHEKQQPINKNVVRTYQNSPANDIIRKFEVDEDIRSIYKIVNTIQALQIKAGFVLKGDLITAVKENYNVLNITLKEKNDISKWLIAFFMELGEIMEDDFKNFRNISETKWSVNWHIFRAYIWLSSILYGNENWKNILHDLLDKIDFSNNGKPWKTGTPKPDRNIISKFKEVLNNEC